MATEKCTLDSFDKTLQRVLEKYADDVLIGLDEVAEATAKGAAAEIRSSARGTFGGSGKYAKGWSQKKTGTWRFGAEWTVYNRNAYQLAHILEYGHAVVSGGRTHGSVAGKAHIQPVEERAVKQFEKEIVKIAKGE